MDPRERLRAQAEHCRRRWRRLDDDGRRALAERLGASDDVFDRVWADVLLRRHPLAAWLDGEEPYDVLSWDDGPSPRQLVSSHPFRDPQWSEGKTSAGSSSTPPGS